MTQTMAGWKLNIWSFWSILHIVNFSSNIWDKKNNPKLNPMWQACRPRLLRSFKGHIKRALDEARAKLLLYCLWNVIHSKR